MIEVTSHKGFRTQYRGKIEMCNDGNFIFIVYTGIFSYDLDDFPRWSESGVDKYKPEDVQSIKGIDERP